MNTHWLPTHATEHDIQRAEEMTLAEVDKILEQIRRMPHLFPEPVNSEISNFGGVTTDHRGFIIETEPRN